jgi:hypothetical protein
MGDFATGDADTSHRDSFHLYINSKDSDVYRRNTSTDFQVLLPSAIELVDTRWKIALQSIFMHTNVSAVPPQECAWHIVIYDITGDAWRRNPPLIRHKLEHKCYTLDMIATELQQSTIDPRDMLNQTVYFRLSENVLPRVLDVTPTGNYQLVVHETFWRWLKFEMWSTTNAFLLPTQHTYLGQQGYLVYPEETVFVGARRRLQDGGGNINPRLVRVQVEEIVPIIGGNGSHKDLAILLAPKLASATTTGRVAYVEVKRREFVSCSQHLARLHVRVTDENSEPIAPTGSPIVLHFVMKKMSRPSFIVRVSSNQGLAEFPRNNNAAFSIQLPSPIDLSEGNWRVAITTMFFPPLVRTVSHMYVSCNFIEPTFCGGTYAKILKVLPSTGSARGNEDEEGDDYNDDDDPAPIQYESTGPLDFFRVSERQLSLLRFELRDIGGQLVRYRNAAAQAMPVLINLVFEQQRSRVV